MKTRVCLKYFVNGWLCQKIFASNSTETTSNLIPLTILSIWVSSLLAKIKALLILAKNLEKEKGNFSRIALFDKKTRFNLKYCLNDCLCKPFSSSNFSQTPSILILLTIVATWRPASQFYPKVRAIKLQNIAKSCLTF